MEVMNGIRFGMFAAAHILWSIVCSPFVPRLLGGDLGAAIITASAMMLAYALLGWLVAHFCRWSVPTIRQSLWAVFLPAGIAWAWAGSTAFFLYAGGELTGLAAILGLPAFLLASPSLLFVMAFMGAVGSAYHSMGFYDETLIMGGAIFFAGLFPSLLFWLGGYIKSRKRGYETKGPETA